MGAFRRHQEESTAGVKERAISGEVGTVGGRGVERIPLEGDQLMLFFIVVLWVSAAVVRLSVRITRGSADVIGESAASLRTSVALVALWML